MYDQILDSILGVTLSVIYDGVEEQTSIPIGAGREIKMPSKFTCDKQNEQTAVINLSFTSKDPNESTIELSNMTFDMCSP